MALQGASQNKQMGGVHVSRLCLSLLSSEATFAGSAVSWRPYRGDAWMQEKEHDRRLWRLCRGLWWVSPKATETGTRHLSPGIAAGNGCTIRHWGLSLLTTSRATASSDVMQLWTPLSTGWPPWEPRKCSPMAPRTPHPATLILGSLWLRAACGKEILCISNLCVFLEKLNTQNSVCWWKPEGQGLRSFTSVDPGIVGLFLITGAL